MKPDTAMMLYQNTPIIDETAAVPLGTAILPPSTTMMTMGRRSSKGMKTTQKKGYSVMRLFTVFGTFAVVLVGVVVLLFICGSWW